MEDEPPFLWESTNCEPAVDRSLNNDDDGIHEDVEDLFRELHGISVEELEVELRRKEKELYLCSRLGLFLAQEVDELVLQRRGILSDHTRLLLELQEYRDSRRSFMDVSDGASEHATTSLSGKTAWNRSTSSVTSPGVDDKQTFELQAHANDVSNLQSQVNDNTPGTLERTDSVESLDLISNAESTLTTSSARDLQYDLDTIQKAHDRITKLEVQLDKTRAKYRHLMTKYAHKLKEMSRELGSCVTKARPYFEAVKKAKKCQHETQQAAIEFKRAVNLQKAARDMVKVAEERVMAAEDKLDPTWQEMLNQANIKVNEASAAKQRIHKIHMKAAKHFQVAEERKVNIQQKIQKSIIKSKPYFEIQKEFQEKLEVTTKKLNILELKLMEARQTYSINLNQLRKSDVNGKSSGAIQSLSKRGIGVGAENPLGLIGSAGVLHKPALDFLERKTTESADGASKTNSDDLLDELSPPAKTKLKYNPYDLLYLTDLGSDSPSNLDSDDDEYLQDF